MSKNFSKMATEYRKHGPLSFCQCLQLDNQSYNQSSSRSSWYTKRKDKNALLSGFDHYYAKLGSRLSTAVTVTQKSCLEYRDDVVNVNFKSLQRVKFFLITSKVLIQNGSKNNGKFMYYSSKILRKMRLNLQK